MYLIERGASNTTAHGILASLTTNISCGARNLLKHATNFVSRYLQIYFRWTVRWGYQAIAALYRASRIPDLLYYIRLIFLRTLKWCGIALACIVGIQITVNLGYWGLPKLWQIYKQSRQRSLEERQENEQIKRRAAYLDELRAHQAAEAAAIKVARMRQVQEEQAIKDKLKKNEEQRHIKARADYKSWEEECDNLFQDKASMTQFPFPPLPRCTQVDCSGCLKTPVPACEHNVKQFFKGSGNFSLALLKRQRQLWHEDRFVSCPTELRPEFKRLANSLFVVLGPWYESLKGEEANSSNAG